MIGYSLMVTQIALRLLHHSLAFVALRLPEAPEGGECAVIAHRRSAALSLGDRVGAAQAARVSVVLAACRPGHIVVPRWIARRRADRPPGKGSDFS